MEDYTDIPIIDPEVSEAEIVDPEAKARPKRPVKPKKKPGPLDPGYKPPPAIKITPQMAETTKRTIQDEYARRLLKQREDQYNEYQSTPDIRVQRPTPLFQQPSMIDPETLDVEDMGTVREDRTLKRWAVEHSDTLIKKELDRRKKDVIKRAAQGKPLQPFEEQFLQQPPEMDLPGMPNVSPDRPSSRLMNDVNAMLGAFLEMGPQMAEGAAEMLDFINSYSPNATPEEIERGNVANKIRPYTRDASSFLRGALPVDEASYPESGLMSGLGSAGGFLAGGLAGRALKIPSMVSTAFMGASINVADVLREADRMGIDPQKRNLALVLAAGTGLTEMAGLGKTIEGFGLQKAFYKRLFEMAEEGGQEGLQQWLNNLNAVIGGGYDQTRPLTKDVVESAILGSLVGGVTHGASAGYEAYSDYKARQSEFQQKKLMETQPLSNAATIPPPADFVAPETQPLKPKAPVGRAVPSGNKMVPLADMGLMAEENNRQANLDKFLEGSQVKVPVYHGTSSYTEIKQIDPSKFDPNALFGPGFYTTQASEIAAGGPLGGYSNTKASLPAADGIIKQYATLWSNKLAEHGANLSVDEMAQLLNNRNFGISYSDVRKALEAKGDTSLDSLDLIGIKEAVDADYSTWTREYEKGQPHAYQLYLNIKNPFDINAPIDPALVPAIDALTGFDYPVKPDGVTPDLDTNFELYDYLKRYFGNKAEVNEWLEYQGYDGITHIGGLGSPGKRFSSREEMEAYAQKIGGRPRVYRDVNPLNVDTNSAAYKILDDYHRKFYPDAANHGTASGILTMAQNIVKTNYSWENPEVTQAAKALVEQVSGPEEYSSEGHKVWIAFRPEQVKSATGNTGEYNPSRPEIYRADGGMVTIPSSVDTQSLNVFEVIPPLGGETDNAPFMLVPRWAMKAVGFATNRGVNLPINQLGGVLKQLRKAAPSEEDARQATKALLDLAEQSIEQDLNSLSLVPQDQTPEAIRGAAQHEVFHAAMRAGLMPKVNWVLNHPLLKKILNRPIIQELYQEGQPMFLQGNTIEYPSIKDAYFSDLNMEDALGALAVEIPAYTMEGRLDVFGITSDEGIDFIFDIYNHLRTEYGQEGIDKLKNLTRMRPAMKEAFDLAQSMWETHQMELNIEDEVDFDWEPDMLASFQGALAAEAPLTPQSRPGGFSKLRNWFSTKKGRKTVQDNPPLAKAPQEEPPMTPPPPPPPGRTPGGGAEGPLGPLFKQHITPEYNQLLVRTFTRMLEQGGIPVDPTVGPPFMQVVKALKDGHLQNVDIDNILEEEGIVWDVFTDMMQETASDAGKVLQSYSEIAAFWNQILDEYEISEGITPRRGKPTGGATGPMLPGDIKDYLRLVPIEFQVRRAMKGIRHTALGKDFWQRAGNVTQKAMLTQISTFAVNTMTTTGQLPLRVATQGMGGWMYQMAEGKGSFSQRLARANEDSLHAMRAGLEVAVALRPQQWADWARLRKGRQFTHYQNVVSQLEGSFPDIHKKLFALSSGTETMKEGKKQLSIAQALMPKVKDMATREKLLKDLKVYEERLEANAKGIGRVLNKTEAMYDFCLQPMQWAEYFLRRPMFVGQLQLELQREGHDLSWVLAHNAFDQIPPEMMERAVNRALEFTYAYMPGTKTGTNYALEQKVEKAAAGIIEQLNKWGGPLNALFGEPFGKAMFNGAKFVYEYSPVGGLLPTNRIVSNWGLRKTVAELNNQIRLGGSQAAAARAVKLKGVINDPVTGKKTVVNETNQEDYDRLAKAMLGTMMYAAVAGLKYALGGDEWWQIKRGKGPDGRPIYFDIRRLKPISTMFQVVDLVERMATGRLGDIEIGATATEIMTGMRKFDNQMGGNIFDSMNDWWNNEPEHTWKTGFEKTKTEAGKALSVYLTPLLNLRDAIAQFDAEENVKKDMKGEGVQGPIMDKIPFLRRLLPNLTSPVEPGPIKLAENPGWAQLTGYKTVMGPNFAGREWSRLGLFNRTFLMPDSDPIINRAQNEAFVQAVGELAAEFEKDPAYLNADDKTKAMMWEIFIAGDKGLANTAREIGSMANPDEAMKREMERKSGMGRFQKKALGFDEMMKEMFPKK